MEGNRMERKIDQSQFTHSGKNLDAAQAIKRPSISYFQDSLRRLKKNIPAIISFWILIFLITMSLIGPIISSKIFGYTYKKQKLQQQNQTPIMTNARNIILMANSVFKYDNYSSNLGKTKIAFTNVKLKSPGKIVFRVGSKMAESQQGDRKEFFLEVQVTGTDTWKSIVQKFESEEKKIIEKDPSFRSVTFQYDGKNLNIATRGDTWFNTIHWLGTDEFGRDLFTRLWEGGRVSFLIAFVSVFVTVIVGVMYGGISGYIGGRVDNFLMRFVEILMTVPDLIYIILLLTVMRPGLGPIIMVMIATGWMGTARLVRGEVMRLKHSEYVIAAQTLGAPANRIILKHLIPNAMGPILVNMTMMVPSMIFAEAFLSFIGLGVPAPFASWGVLANQGANMFREFPHQLLIPAIAISLTMFGFNILGDGLRDALDPRLRK